ncbi:hypothetical protein FOA43_003815 [Brettanomyces nanus]|uniref:Uncharacterized protein n=1 Tax=Eeniella nana TaxID=13502 RepID=A0A875S561_EENNA|nr:uncharacterized protein FOA43_003815 [Brettanomyces nanus]QPG76426.1 hypothetical protein FOA43_003815 [Brettanomyces nanus]
MKVLEVQQTIGRWAPSERKKFIEWLAKEQSKESTDSSDESLDKSKHATDLSKENLLDKQGAEVTSTDQSNTGNGGLLRTPQKVICDIVHTFNELRQTTSLVGGNCQSEYLLWLEKMKRSAEDRKAEMIRSEKQLNDQFISSLETIKKIFQLLLNCNVCENQESTMELLGDKIQPIMSEFLKGKLQKLRNYSSDSLTMSTLNELAKTDILKLEPIIEESISDLSKKLQKFYRLLDLVGECMADESFLHLLPSKDEVQSLSVFIKDPDTVKMIMSTKFSNVNSELLNKLDDEIDVVERLASERINQVKVLQTQARSLSAQLFISIDDLDTTVYTTDEEFKEHISLTKESIQRYQDKVAELDRCREKRQEKLDLYMKRVGDLWSILRSDDSSIQKFLKENKNLKEESLIKFEDLLKQLEQEKRDNMAKFIQASQERVKGYWDLLMYDENERRTFKEYYVEDTDQFDNKLLNSYSAEIEKLRKEAENLKPLIQNISLLDKLLEDKHQVDESSKDPSRLLRRDSFKILRREEKTRTRLGKLLPVTIDKIKKGLTEYSAQGGRIIKVNGEPYIERIKEIEQTVIHRRPRMRARSQRINKQVIQPSKGRVRTRSLRTTSEPYRSIHATPAHSIIRHRSTSEMTNPFLSRENTPHKRAKLNDGSHSSNFQLEKRLGSPIVFSDRFDESTGNRRTDSIQSLNISGSTTVSNKPIVIKGGSPVRHLDYSTASKTQVNQNFMSMPKLRLSLTPHSQAGSESLVPVSLDHHTNLSVNKKFRYPTSSHGLLQNGPNISVPATMACEKGISRKRVASYQMQPVEELSDSLIYFSESETPVLEDKENQPPQVVDAGNLKQLFSSISAVKPSISWETDTF